MDVVTVTDSTSTEALRDLVQKIIAAESGVAIRMLEASPELASLCAVEGAMRQAPDGGYFAEIAHYMYEGDTALHMASAAKRSAVVEKLIAQGANVNARNRRGATPLHYAVDGGPGSPTWNPAEQSIIITALIGAGADPNGLDKSGVAPLHRAVRNRSAAAVAALIAGGANPNAANKNGSTPLDLAKATTGKSGAGLPEAKAQCEAIVRILLEQGAR